MASDITIPPVIIVSGKFPNVFRFPRKLIVGDDSNVLLVANLFNFAVASDQPLTDHKQFIRDVVAPMLRANLSAGVRLTGLASRSGRADFNLALSLRRANKIKDAVTPATIVLDITNPPGNTPRVKVGAQGEKFAENFGEADGTENPWYRGVLLTVLADRTKPASIIILPP